MKCPRLVRLLTPHEVTIYVFFSAQTSQHYLGVPATQYCLHATIHTLPTGSWGLASREARVGAMPDDWQRPQDPTRGRGLEGLDAPPTPSDFYHYERLTFFARIQLEFSRIPPEDRTTQKHAPDISHEKQNLLAGMRSPRPSQKPRSQWRAITADVLSVEQNRLQSISVSMLCISL